MRAGSDTLLLKLYRAATDIIGPTLPLWIKYRAFKGKEDPNRLSERRGLPSISRPPGDLVWMHGASVGECTMLLPLITKMRSSRPDLNILLTSGTVTAAKVMAERLPEGAFHQYVSLDRRKYVKTFLEHWAPDMAIWAESEIWPNMIMQADVRGIKMALLNARMSEKTLNGWTKRKASAEAIFSRFDLIVAADKRTGDSLGGFTSRNIAAAGNLKDAAPALPAPEEELRKLREAVTGRPVWCAASTHAGEDELILRAHKDVIASHPNALLILAPRHPERRKEVLNLIHSSGYAAAMRSQGEAINADTQIYLFDTIGEMGLAYRLAALTVMCGSLVKGLSGHNPLEPACLGSAVMTGGHIASFADIYNTMFKFNAAHRIVSPEIIGKEVVSLLGTPEKLSALQNKALKFAKSRNDVLAFVWSELLPLLPPKRQS